MNKTPLQGALWRETIYKALDDSIVAIAPAGRNPYEWMASKLWPTKPDKTRYARLKACLDPHQENTNFNPDELLHILAAEDEAEVVIVIKYLMDALNRNIGEKCAPKSPKTLLLERQAALAAEMARVQREMDLADQAELRAVK